MRALVVDDSRTMRMMLRRSLMQMGYEVIEAGDGQQALDQIEKSGAPDLALVDWNMPVMTGYELILEVRARRELDSMVIIMVTSETEAAQVQRALDAGANEFVMKPFTEQALREKMGLLGIAPG